MSRASRIIVADADTKNAGLLAFGFEREGISPVVAHAAADIARLALTGDVDGVVLSMSPGVGVDAVKALRAGGPSVARLPILALGDSRARTDLLAAGATDFLPRPNFVRDVVTLARFHSMRKANSATMWSGELHDFAGIFYLIRAISSVQRTGVLTIVRSLRRAELRFFEGEVTSAQLGALHGLAALHQLLLWTEGKLDFRQEVVVRRQQIPLAPAELIDDLGRFLRDFHELAPELSPGVVLEQDLRRVAECVDKIPKEVNPVLRLFDGARMLSDVVEDSPFRVFETAKIAARLCKLGAIKPVVRARTGAGSHSALKVDDWLVGSTPPAGVPALMTTRESEPVGSRPGEPMSPPEAASAAGAAASASSVAAARQKKKAKKDREREQGRDNRPTDPPGASSAAAGASRAAADASAGDAATADSSVDWGRLPGAASSVWDLPGYAPVVPSQVVTGEISSAAVTRPSPDVNLAAAGKVVAQDLQAAVQGVVRSASVTTPPPPVSHESKVMIDSGGAPVPSVIVRTTPVPGAVPAPHTPPAITGTARERVDEISSPVPRAIESAPVPRAIEITVARATQPGPAPAPVPHPPQVLGTPAPRKSVPPVITVLPADPVVTMPEHESVAATAVAVEPAVAPAPVGAPIEAAVVVSPVVFAPVTVAAVVAAAPAPAPTADQEARSDGGIVSGELSGMIDARATVHETQGPEYAEKIVVIEAEFDPPSPSMEMAAEPPPPDVYIQAAESAAAAAAAALAVSAAPIISTPSVYGTMLPSIADEEPSSPAAPMPSFLREPAAAPVVEPAAVPAAVVTAMPSAPTLAMTGAPPPAAVAAPPPAAVAAPPPAVLASSASAASAADAARSAADAAQAAARAVSFDAIDEEFFNQEHQFATAKAGPTESFDDLDGGYAPPPKAGFWRRLIGGAPPPPQRRRRPTTVPPPGSARTTGPQNVQRTTGPQPVQRPTGPQRTTGPQKIVGPGGKLGGNKPSNGGKPSGNKSGKKR